jgi:hypothetical protein
MGNLHITWTLAGVSSDMNSASSSEVQLSPPTPEPTGEKHRPPMQKGRDGADQPP